MREDEPRVAGKCLWKACQGRQEGRQRRKGGRELRREKRQGAQPQSIDGHTWQEGNQVGGGTCPGVVFCHGEGAGRQSREACREER